ncbi:MAG: right-handed parallel beta-helix repeat-containing protein [Nitrososphaerota archaeon]|jgi:parallel beta-helix repeat protein|nr:right-handed parallel beta-helix repeat-containing protein [Nitrososphaerota archaeon]
MNKTRKFLVMIFLAILSISFFTAVVNFENVAAQTAYTISVRGTNYYVSDAPTTAYPTANAAFSHAAKIVSPGEKIYVDEGRYIASGSPIQMQNMTDIEIFFHPKAILTIPDNFNQAVFRLWYSHNVTINGITVDGNRFRQEGSLFAAIYNINGIVIGDSSFCTVINANITNVRGYGFQTGNNYPTLGNNGIRDSIITFCDWNGMCINWGGPYSHDDFAINNIVAAFSDVGITSLGSGAIITDNYIYDGNGTRGSEPPPAAYARYGIAIEAQYKDKIGGNIIVNNTIENMAGDWCGAGMAIGTTFYVENNEVVSGVNKNYIANNIIRNCTTGISTYFTNGDVIVNNTIENWRTEAGAAGIWLNQQSHNEIIIDNILITNIDRQGGWANGIQIDTESNYNTIVNNTIIIPVNAKRDGIYLASSSHSFIANNTISSYRGIYAAKGSDYNRFKTNNFIDCTIDAVDDKDNKNNLWIGPSTLTPTVLFYDGFESGNANAWTGSFGSGITYSTSTKHNGTYSAHIPSSDRFIWELVNPVDELYTSAYLYIDNLPPEGKVSHLMFIGTGSNHYASNTLAELTVKTSGGVSILCLTYAYAGGSGLTRLIETNQAVSAHTWFKITLYYGQNSVAKLWYNDDLIIESGSTYEWLKPKGLWLQAYTTGSCYYDDCTIYVTTGLKINTINSEINTSILAVNNPTIYASINPQGLYTLQNTNKQTITATTNDNYIVVLNVDGTNITLTNNPYEINIDMTSDHIIYTIQTIQTNLQPDQPKPPPPPTKNILFSDGFESGDASKWTGTRGTITYNTNIAYNSTYSAYISVADTFIYKLINPRDEVYASAYLYIDKLPAEGQISNLLFIGQGSAAYANNELAMLTLKTTGGVTTLCLRYAYANGGLTQLIDTEQTITAKTWFKITLSYERNSTQGAKMWYNDKLIAVSGPTNEWLQPSGLWLQAYITGSCNYDDCEIYTINQEYSTEINNNTSTEDPPTAHASTAPRGTHNRRARSNR